MTVQFQECEVPATAQDIKGIEALLGHPLPAEYAQHIRQYNGGRPEPCGFYFQSDDGQKMEGMVAWFFSIGDEEYENLEENIRSYKNRIPVNFMPFGRDPGDNVLCLGLHGAQKGKIALWLRELEVAEGELPDYSNMAFVADSFTAFLNGLFDPT